MIDWLVGWLVLYLVLFVCLVVIWVGRLVDLHLSYTQCGGLFFFGTHFPSKNSYDFIYRIQMFNTITSHRSTLHNKFSHIYQTNIEEAEFRWCHLNLFNLKTFKSIESWKSVRKSFLRRFRNSLYRFCMCVTCTQNIFLKIIYVVLSHWNGSRSSFK